MYSESVYAVHMLTLTKLLFAISKEICPLIFDMTTISYGVSIRRN